MSTLGQQFADTKTFGSGEYITDGDYDWIVEGFKEQKGYNGLSIIVELRIVRGDKISDVEPNRVGSSVSSVCNVTKHKEAALGAAKRALAGILGCDAEQLTKKDYDDAISADQPCRGMMVSGRTFTKRSQGRYNQSNAGKEYLDVKWRSVGGQTPESIAENCRKLGEVRPSNPPAMVSESAPMLAAPTAPVAPSNGVLSKFIRR